MKKTLADTLYNPNQDTSWEDFMAHEMAVDVAMEYVVGGRI